jgi:uncharacterized protein with NRDE domain
LCTFVIAHRIRPDFPLVVGATRDEFYARPTTSPALHDGRVLAGRDVERGGSWLGATTDGLFVGLTNQRSNGRLDVARRTRGEVVMRALAARTFDEIAAYASGIDAAEYNGFNLLFGDGDRLAVAYARPREGVTVVPIAPGFYVLPNDRLDHPDWPKVGRARAVLAPHLGAPWPAFASALVATLGDHERPPLETIPEPAPGSPLDRALLRELSALCIHTPRYGTRSATITAILPGRLAHHLVADGAPCVTPFVERAPL